MKFIEYNFSHDLTGKDIIGIDEVGVGDYFGPLCCAAVFIPHENLEKVKELGVDDSKKISNEKIKYLAKKLKSSTLIKYSIHHLSPSGYNSLNKTYNANVLKMFTHLNAFRELTNKFVKDYDYVFIDQYSNKESIEKYYDELINVNNWAGLKPIKSDVFIATNGENYSLSVAAASVLARDYFLSYMENMNKKYMVNFPFGAGSKVKEFAIKFFKENNFDKNLINNVCKKSFKMGIEEETENSESIELF